MKRLMILAGLLGILVIAPPAQAAISQSYCHASLRGQTGQAPDNDVRNRWDILERTNNIISSSPGSYWANRDRYYPGVGLYEETSGYWRFTNAFFQVADYWAVCFRENYGPAAGQYRDTL